MLNWKKIQDLNLKEVVTKTQIELDFLEALVKKDFTVLNRFNVKGFIKILSREYDLDFSDFNEEYEAYLNENNLNPQTKPKMITPKLDAYTQKSFNIWSFLITFAILVILVGGVYYFDTIKTFFKSEQNNTSATVVDIIGQAQENLKSLGANVVVIDNNKVNEEKPQELDEIVINSSNQDTKDQENNEQNTSSQNDENQIIKENISIEEIPKVELLKEAHFKISSKIWIGLIDLKNFKKTSFVKEEDFNVSLDKDQLILTGASALTLYDETNKKQEFPAGNLKRFLIKDGKITSIQLAEFVKLNRGREW